MQTKIRGHRWQVPVVAGMLAIVIMGIVFAVQGITPFGNHNLLISDMGGQYLSFFTAYRHAILTHSFQLYSFSQSLGGNALPTIAYYLLSPFNLIILLFPAANIPTGLSVLIMLKIAAIAITMTIFLQNHFYTSRWSTAIFGLAFSLSGFVALNYFTIMWLDALIWLPLVIDGLDHLIKTGHPARFFGWLWVSIITDYYLGYMTVLFVIYYFIYQLFELKTPNASIWQTCKQQSKLIRNVILTTLFSGLSTMFLLIPTGLGMLTTAKSAVKLSSYLPIPEFGLSVFSQLGLGANSFATRLSHAPTLFSSTLVVLLALAYFVHPLIKKGHKKHVAGLLIALFLSMEIRTIDTMWHMFQRPAGFPYRNAFFFSFVLIMVAFEAWQADPQKIALKWRWQLPTLLAGLLIIGWFVQLSSADLLAISTLLLSLIAVIATALALFTTINRQQQLLLAGIVIAELGTNSYLTMQNTSYGNESAYIQAYKREYQQMQTVNDPDGQLYRVENQNTLINQAFSYNSKYRNYNDPMLFNFHDITYYSSTFTNQTRLMLKSLGLYSKNVRRVSSEGLNPVSELLLDIKYDVQLNVTGSANTSMRSNNGLGFVVSNAFKQLSLQANSALANQEKILQSLQPSKTPYFASATVLNDKVKSDPSATTYGYLHTVQLRMNNTGSLYYNDTLGNSKFSTMRVNGHLVPTKFNADGAIVSRYLGDFTKGTVVTLTVKRTQPILGTHVHIASLNQAKFNQVKQSLLASRFTPTYHVTGTQTVVSGQITNRSNQKWLYIAIPADKGWSATVNGQAVTPQTVIGGMTALPIQAGKNQIQMTYHVPGLRPGVIISLISLVSFGLLNVWFRRRKQQD
ncbi:YfhO family protein [Lactiplantibacillus herbarum]|uniref:YfhO family protein n=1 Tax=Lactiplantibacillus herbarum TaxID=1670446 RepID=UPI00064F04A0|nr:YfhO family protein [Lactiplantibacillus herbarum]